MGFIRDMFNNTEKVITRQLVSNKVQSFIDGFSTQMNATNDNADVVNAKIALSTGLVAEMIDTTFDAFIEGFKGTNSIITDTLNKEADTITDLITNNKDHIVSILTAIKMMQNHNNKEQMRYLTNAFAEPVKQFLHEDFTNLLDAIGESRIQPKTVELASIWGVTHKWFIINEDSDELIEVTESNYKLYADQYRKDNGHWYETKSYLRTYQSTRESYEHAKATGRQTK